MLKRIALVAACLYGSPAGAWENTSCPAVTQSTLQSALKSAISQVHGQLGLGLNMWATIVASDGKVCLVANSSDDAIQGQWLASRVISAQKAFTAATLSLGPTPNSGSNSKYANGRLALSTANLYSAVQPGGSLYGLATSNPVAVPEAYGERDDSPAFTGAYGTVNDPMVGQIIGGINVFGGGLALYAKGGTKVGGLGVSGATSCTDHLIAWNTRHNLGLDHLGSINGVSGDTQRPDNIVFDIGAPQPSGWGHPACGYSNADATSAAAALPAVSK